MKVLAAAAAALAIMAVVACTKMEAQSALAGAGKEKSVYDYSLKSLGGKEVKLEQYRGKVLMVVNVASRCGYTPQYEGLQKIYDRYKDRGFVILGFPANNFGGQEPGTDQEIQSFCRLNYGVTFPMFSKISVKGDDKHPFYKYLTEKETNPNFAGEIKWNFNKFLIDRDGRVVARFDSGDTPESVEVTRAIEQALGSVN